MKRIQAGVQAEEFGQHGGHQIQAPLAAEIGLAHSQRGFHAANGVALEQPVHPVDVGGDQTVQLQPPFALGLAIGEGAEVVGEQRHLQRVDFGQRLIVQRQVGDQLPVQSGVQRRRHRRADPPDVAKARIFRRRAGGRGDVAGPELFGQIAVGTGQRDGHRLGRRHHALIAGVDEGQIVFHPAAHRGRPDARAIEHGPAVASIGLHMLEGLKRAVLPLPATALQPSFDPLDGVDLVMGRLLAGRAQAIFGLGLVDTDGIGVAVEQVGDGGAVQAQRVLAHPHLLLQRPAELEHQVQAVATGRQGQPVQTGHIQEQELLRQVEIFLQQPVSGEGVGAIGQQPLVVGEPGRTHRIGPQIENLGVLAIGHPDAGAGQIVAEPQQQRLRHLRIAVDVEPQPRQVQPVQRHARQRLEADRQRRAGPGRLHRRLGHTQRLQVHVVAGAEPAGGALHGYGIDLGAAGNALGLAHRVGHRLELQDRHGRHGAQVVGPHQRDQPVGQFGQVVVQLLAQPAGQEGEPFQQAFHVRVGAPVAQERGQLGVGLGKLLAQIAQIGQFVLKVFVERHGLSLAPSPAPRSGRLRRPRSRRSPGFPRRR